MFNRRQPDAHGAGQDLTWLRGKIHMRREHSHPVPQEIGGQGPQWVDSSIVIEDSACEGSRVMGLQIGGLPGKLSVTGGVRLIKGISYKVCQDVPNGAGLLRPDAGLSSAYQELLLQRSHR